MSTHEDMLKRYGFVTESSLEDVAEDVPMHKLSDVSANPSNEEQRGYTKRSEGYYEAKFEDQNGEPIELTLEVYGDEQCVLYTQYLNNRAKMTFQTGGAGPQDVACSDISAIALVLATLAMSQP